MEAISASSSAMVSSACFRADDACRAEPTASEVSSRSAATSLLTLSRSALVLSWASLRSF
eukprot:CAMPEP_0171908324 /NCGR_PEP_ID=MMETSP0993-20121228/7771_1 /TAXON_ID=483369 /ORGANISM="non described non described, Strain CCMP2098" /LENGTH=59 /DNA_ID=CAMNT_0012540883 /DNA_START=32 /DNA_END=208 /DNA_ORIENTATION=+